jgi:hypothetical protein
LVNVDMVESKVQDLSLECLSDAVVVFVSRQLPCRSVPKPGVRITANPHFLANEFTDDLEGLTVPAHVTRDRKRHWDGALFSSTTSLAFTGLSDRRPPPDTRRLNPESRRAPKPHQKDAPLQTGSTLRGALPLPCLPY